MKRIQRFCIAIMTVFILITSITSITFAHEDDIGITDIMAAKGRISANITNNSESDVILTITLEKADDTLKEEQRFYAIRQKNLKAGETIEFGVMIPDVRDGVQGSGNYILCVQNRKKVDERKSFTFDYADNNEIEAYMQELKDAATDNNSDKTYEKILSILEHKDSDGVFFSIGADYDAFMELGEEVRQEIASLVYYNAETTLVADEFAKEFIGLFGLGLYNSGDKKEGIISLSPEYNGESANESLYAGVLDRMDDSYQSNIEFLKDFKLAYGLETINLAKMNTIEAALQVFDEETGLCESEIDRIMGLSQGKRDVAFRYIITMVDSSPINTEDKLEELLQKAYKEATASTSTGSGGGGGGGAIGSVSNKSENKQSSMSSALGSGVPEMKAEDTLIFPDLPGSHWAAESIRKLKEFGVISGTDSGYFEPDRAVTREEFAKMLVVVCEFESANITEFTDVDKDEWYASYIGAAVNNGIVKGIGDNKFGVGNNITRQDMAVMVQRTLETKKLYPEKLRSYVKFSDGNMIADYAENAIKSLFEASIINGKGDGIFDPLGTATRAEAAKIIYEAMRGVI